MNGIDISEYQGEIDFAAVQASGKVQFVYAKATEGLRTNDACFVRNHDECKRTSIPFGAYHFFHFGEDPESQASHFLQAIEGYRGQLLPMVDVEGGGQDRVTDLAALTHALAAFNAKVEAAIGKPIVIYTDYGDWNGFMQGTDAFSGHPLWIAEYNSDAAPTLPGGWSDWKIWQYSSSGSIPGISGNVDCDRLNPRYSLEDITL